MLVYAFSNIHPLLKTLTDACKFSVPCFFSFPFAPCSLPRALPAIVTYKEHTCCYREISKTTLSTFHSRVDPAFVSDLFACVRYCSSWLYARSKPCRLLDLEDPLMASLRATRSLGVSLIKSYKFSFLCRGLLMLGITTRCRTISWYVYMARLSDILPPLTFVIHRLASETVIPILCSA